MGFLMAKHQRQKVAYGIWLARLTPCQSDEVRILPSILTSGDIVYYRYATQGLHETRCCFASESAAPSRFATLWVYVTAD